MKNKKLFLKSIFALSVLALGVFILGAQKVSAADFDCGLRMQSGGTTLIFSCEPSGTLTSKLRIQKGATTYGVNLVDPSDPLASKTKIQIAAGVTKALKLMPVAPPPVTDLFITHASKTKRACNTHKGDKTAGDAECAADWGAEFSWFDDKSVVSGVGSDFHTGAGDALKEISDGTSSQWMAVFNQALTNNVYYGSKATDDPGLSTYDGGQSTCNSAGGQYLLCARKQHKNPPAMILSNVVGFSGQAAQEASFDVIHDGTRFVVAWQEDGTHKLWFKFMDSAGDDIGGPFLIDDTLGFHTKPTIAFDDTNKRYLIIWEKTPNNGGYGTSSLMYSLFDTNGAIFNGKNKITAITAIDARNKIEVAFNPVQRRYIVGMGSGQQFGADIYYGLITLQHIDANGALSGSNFLVARSGDQPNEDTSDFSLAYSPASGDYMVTYFKTSPYTEPLKIVSRKVAYNGTTYKSTVINTVPAPIINDSQLDALNIIPRADVDEYLMLYSFGSGTYTIKMDSTGLLIGSSKGGTTITSTSKPNGFYHTGLGKYVIAKAGIYDFITTANAPGLTMSYGKTATGYNSDDVPPYYSLQNHRSLIVPNYASDNIAFFETSDRSNASVPVVMKIILLPSGEID